MLDLWTKKNKYNGNEILSELRNAAHKRNPRNECRWYTKRGLLHLLLQGRQVYTRHDYGADDRSLRPVNKVVAPAMEPIKSISGFRTLPDYSFETMSDDYAALVLIGGFGWTTPIAEQVVPIVRQAVYWKGYAGCRPLWFQISESLHRPYRVL